MYFQAYIRFQPPFSALISRTVLLDSVPLPYQGAVERSLRSSEDRHQIPALLRAAAGYEGSLFGVLSTRLAQSIPSRAGAPFPLLPWILLCAGGVTGTLPTSSSSFPLPRRAPSRAPSAAPTSSSGGGALVYDTRGLC